MKTITNLNQLLKSMQPKLLLGEFVFCIVKDVPPRFKPKMIFQEEEGVTLILEKEVADKNKLYYDKVWSLITLNVNSDLSAVGFLAAITPALAQAGISVNVVSAYHHDHLFVPEERAEEAIKILRKLSLA
ncbi:ACT domain-containing protein [Candidatus Woesearchaeota archaeon]|nr:ACT domain-containing protein [Candidatus Woesearchaeota archaeon]